MYLGKGNTSSPLFGRNQNPALYSGGDRPPIYKGKIVVRQWLHTFVLFCNMKTTVVVGGILCGLWWCNFNLGFSLLAFGFSGWSREGVGVILILGFLYLLSDFRDKAGRADCCENGGLQ